jgi:hypothetical protein
VRRIIRTPYLACALAILVAIAEAPAQITRIEIVVVESPALDGMEVPGIGTYERLRGVFHGQADPSDPRNREIADIDLAPRNSAGRVEYATSVEMYRPTDAARWNGAVHHIVPNRGRASAPDPALLEMGFAFVQVGWQGDLDSTSTNVAPLLPTARRASGTPVTGVAFEEFIFDDRAARSQATLSYPAATLEPAAARLTVRPDRTSPAIVPASPTWRYLSPTRIEIDRPDEFDGGAIYEFVYEAADPIVMGLGFAAVRDAISFLRYELEDPSANPNPIARGRLPESVLSIGISQSGRFLRDMLYLGFNEDLQGRIVFDGIHPDIAGSRKTFTNYRFGQPGRWQKQHEDHLYPGDQFPFTYTTLFDPNTGRRDGLLERCSASGTCPKIIHTDGEAEIWQARSSLVVTDPAGEHVELPEDVRVYLIAGTQHGGGSGVHVGDPGFGVCQNRANPMSIAQIRRALTIALFEWVTDGTEPPPSRFPTVANGELVPAAELVFPAIPGVTFSGSYNPLYLLDHRVVPPVQLNAYTVVVGRVDEDGNMVGGIRHPNLEVPIGTYTGWNLRGEGFAAGAQCGGSGSFFPFAATADERRTTGDPRLSLEERYPSNEEYVSRVAEAAGRLVAERLLLPRDAEEIIELARGSSIGRSE